MKQRFQNFYCIEHEQTVMVDTDYDAHPIFIVHDDMVLCAGPFAFCLPPELPADWIEHVTPPTPEELVQIDQNAMELAFDLELA